MQTDPNNLKWNAESYVRHSAGPFVIIHIEGAADKGQKPWALWNQNARRQLGRFWKCDEAKAEAERIHAQRAGSSRAAARRRHQTFKPEPVVEHVKRKPEGEQLGLLESAWGGAS